MALIRVKTATGPYVNIEIEGRSTITFGELKTYNDAARGITWSGNAVFVYPSKHELSTDDAIIDLTEGGGTIRMLLTQKRMKAGSSSNPFANMTRDELYASVRRYRTLANQPAFLNGYSSYTSSYLASSLNTTAVKRVLFPQANVQRPTDVNTSPVAELRALATQIREAATQQITLADRFLSLYETRFGGLTDAEFEAQASSMRFS